jgi:uncharacterized RDD family membrane protein YckC
MKCPKCGYLGFDSVDRCRNCGWAFSLAQPGALPEMPLRGDPAPLNPLDDLSIVDMAAAQRSTRPSGEGSDVKRGLTTAASPPRTPKQELPLFGRLTPPRGSDAPVQGDEPLIRRPSPPRPPLAVRRPTTEISRQRRMDSSGSRSLGESASSEPVIQTLDLGLDLEEPRARTSPVSQGREQEPDAGQMQIGSASAGPESADVRRRLLAVSIDALLLAAIDAVVVYLTLQICGISLQDFSILPKAPLVAFLMVQNGGYLVAFTVGGQTLGKMAAGIRVVPADAGEPLDLGRAFVRTLIWMVLAIPAGLGFLTLFSRDGRGLHDRFAGTRVIRAPV